MSKDNPIYDNSDARRPENEGGPQEFGLDGDGIARENFFGSDVEETETIVVYADSDATPSFIRNIRYFGDRDGDKVRDGNERTTRDFDVKVFVSKDATKLQQAFEANEPGRNELCIFLEDNHGDSISGSHAAMRMGEAMRSFLAGRSNTEDSDRGWREIASEIMEDLEELFGQELSFTEEQIIELIEHGRISNVQADLAFFFVQALNASTVIGADLFKLMGDAIAAVTTFLRDNIKVPEVGWDPAAKKETENEIGETVEVENTEFHPYLIPGGYTAIDAITKILDEGAEALVDEIRTTLEYNRDLVKACIEDAGTFDVPLYGEVDLAPEQFRALLLKAYDAFERLLDVFLEAMLDVADVLNYVGKKILNVINAVYCGIWNSLVEAVLGIVDLIGLIFNANAAAGKFLRNANENIPYFFELIDEGIQSIQEVNFGAIFSELIEQIKGVNFPAFTYEINIEKIAYFYGAFIGFIIEMLVEAFITGGTAAVVSIFEKVGTVGARFSTKVLKGITDFFGMALEEFAENLLTVISKLIQLLKKGSDELLAMIRRFFDSLKGIIKLAAEDVRKLIRTFDIDPADVEAMNSAGIHFLRLSDEAMAAASDAVCIACQISRKTP